MSNIEARLPGAGPVCERCPLPPSIPQAANPPCVWAEGRAHCGKNSWVKSVCKLPWQPDGVGPSGMNAGNLLAREPGTMSPIQQAGAAASSRNAKNLPFFSALSLENPWDELGEPLGRIGSGRVLAELRSHRWGWAHPHRVRSRPLGVSTSSHNTQPSVRGVLAGAGSVLHGTGREHGEL